VSVTATQDAADDSPASCRFRWHFSVFRSLPWAKSKGALCGYCSFPWSGRIPPRKVLCPSVTSLCNPHPHTRRYNKDNFPKGQLSGSGNRGRPVAV